MPQLPEHLLGCPAKRGLAPCYPRCADAYPEQICLFVYTKHGLTPPLIENSQNKHIPSRFAVFKKEKQINDEA